jgi:hypothetical protein
MTNRIMRLRWQSVAQPGVKVNLASLPSSYDPMALELLW